MSVTLTFHEQYGVDVDQPLIINESDSFDWDGEADLVIVGLGGAGVAAALEGCERGLKVIAVDRYEGGGSSRANGGVFYAGGGTAIQKAAGEDDSPEDMYDYLKIEVGDVVSDATLRRFVAQSPETIDWILAHGGKLSGNVWRQKTSYPPLDYYLYHPDNSLVSSYKKRAKPAARGHRAAVRNGNKAWGLGFGIFDPLRDAALATGLEFHPFTEARQLVQDQNGRVIGVKVLSIPSGSADARRFVRYINRANRCFELLPPSLPFASISFALGKYYLDKARKIEERARRTLWLRAKQGVLLSAGGFIMNPKMVAHYAPNYAGAMPNGTLGDQGAGIVMGMSVGGATAMMDKISAWRSINPPKAWGDAIIVNARGERFVDETSYSATLGEHIGDYQNGRAWLIYDAPLRKQAFAQAKNKNMVAFQRDVAYLNLFFNAKKAPTLDALAHRMGFDPASFSWTVARYNAAAHGQEPDQFDKAAEDMQPIQTGPFYAMDVSVESKFLPLPVITFGGLRVNEDNGQVLDGSGHGIAGLYAAGRCAIGIASKTYVSGLSYADCVFSGRRVARHMAGNTIEASLHDAS